MTPLDDLARELQELREKAEQAKKVGYWYSRVDPGLILDVLDEREKLRESIRQVLEDEESRPGGWGPDVTCAEILRAALGEEPA